MDHREEELFRAFALPAKRERYVELLQTKRGRDKIRIALDHFDDLDSRFCKQVPASEQTPARILKMLRGLGRPLNATSYLQTAIWTDTRWICTRR